MMAIIFCINGEKKDLIRKVMAVGALAMLGTSIYLTYQFLALREAGDTAEFLICADIPWYQTLNINYSVGVDGISVAMLLLSTIVVITGVFASWGMEKQTKEYLVFPPPKAGKKR